MACCTPFRQSTNIVGKKWSFTKFSTKASNPSLLQFDKVNHHQLTLMSQIATKFELERNIIVVQNQLARDRTVSLDIKSINSLYIWMICRTNVKHSLVQYLFISFYSHSCLPYKSENQRMQYKINIQFFSFQLGIKAYPRSIVGPPAFATRSRLIALGVKGVGQPP